MQAAFYSCYALLPFISCFLKMHVLCQWDFDIKTQYFDGNVYLMGAVARSLQLTFYSNSSDNSAITSLYNNSRQVVHSHTPATSTCEVKSVPFYNKISLRII